MKTTVTGRHMDVTGVLKEYATDKADKLGKRFDGIHRAEIVFTPERDAHYAAEIILHADGRGLLVVHARDKTATAAFDVVMEKAERQLVRLKDRLRGLGKGPKARRSAAGETEAVLGDASGDSWW